MADTKAERHPRGGLYFDDFVVGHLYEHRLRDYALDAGFREVRPHAVYEVFDPVWEILDLLIDQCAQRGHADHAQALKAWGEQPGVMFTEAWVSCVGRK